MDLIQHIIEIRNRCPFMIYGCLATYSTLRCMHLERRAAIASDSLELG